MSSDKRNSDLQRFLDRLQQALPVADHVDAPELAQLLDEYSRICAEANSRLRECYDLIQRGQYADAVDLSEREPKLLQRLTMLEIPERDRLAAAAMCAGTRAPNPGRSAVIHAPARSVSQPAKGVGQSQLAA